MSDHAEEDSFFEELAGESTYRKDTPAPDRLKQQILFALADAMEEDRIFENLAAEVPSVAAPPRLKSRIYSALVSAQAESGPLLSLGKCKESGRPLCVFEEIVRIAPVGQVAQSINYCRVCHARVLGEMMEHAPIYWPGCPYSDFQNH